MSVKQFFKFLLDGTKADGQEKQILVANVDSFNSADELAIFSSNLGYEVNLIDVNRSFRWMTEVGEISPDVLSNTKIYENNDAQSKMNDLCKVISHPSCGPEKQLITHVFENESLGVVALTDNRSFWISSYNDNLSSRVFKGIDSDASLESNVDNFNNSEDNNWSECQKMIVKLWQED